jgi:hypothetical protein
MRDLRVRHQLDNGVQTLSSTLEALEGFMVNSADTNDRLTPGILCHSRGVGYPATLLTKHKKSGRRQVVI